MVVGAIDQQNSNWRMAQRFRCSESSKSATDNNHDRRASSHDDTRSKAAARLERTHVSVHRTIDRSGMIGGAHPTA